MAKVEFASDYDHRWPSGAETAFKAGWSGTVKQEVEEAAQRAGVLVGAKPRAAAPVAGGKRKRGRPPTAKPAPAPAPLPPADDPAAVVQDPPGAEGDPVPPNTDNAVDAASDSQ